MNPFGSAINTRAFVASTKYRYGFNTQEKDDEVAGVNNSYTAEFWQYDGRLGRKFNLDPITYPWHSSYACLNNSPLYFVDPDGLYSKRRKAERMRRKAERKGFETQESYFDETDGEWKFKIRFYSQKKKIYKSWKTELKANVFNNGYKKSFGFIITSYKEMSFEFPDEVGNLPNYSGNSNIGFGFELPKITLNLEAWAGIKLKTKAVDAVIGRGTLILGFKDNQFYLLSYNFSSQKNEMYEEKGFSILGNKWDQNLGKASNFGVFQESNFVREQGKWVLTSKEIETKIYGIFNITQVVNASGKLVESKFGVDISTGIGFGLAANAGFKWDFLTYKY